MASDAVIINSINSFKQKVSRVVTSFGVKQELGVALGAQRVLQDLVTTITHVFHDALR